MHMITKLLASIAVALLVSAGSLAAEQSEAFSTPAIVASLITAENGVAPGAGYLSAGLKLTLNEGWKTYWRSPGEVGLPPKIDWSGSTNLAAAEFLWPAPTRFRAYGIENFGYANHVTFPIRLSLETPGQPAQLNASVFMLVCSEVCIPQDFTLTLDLPAGTVLDQVSAMEIATWSAKVPIPSSTTDLRVTANLSSEQSVLTLAFEGATDWATADVFPELSDGSAFGKPDIRPAPDGNGLWASFPIFGAVDDADALSLTLTTEATAVAFENVALVDAAPVPPFETAAKGPGLTQRVQMLVLALLGGLILNLMPCVLPVLSIKFSSALKAKDRPLGQVRLGFLASAAGTLMFMWLLAIAVLALQALGVSVGWGMQFQSPGFLIALILVLGLFSANLFGMFEFNLPQGLMSRLSNTSGSGYIGDFATGMFAAVMATPCSAPLLGTALAFALTGSPLDVVMIFTAMGLGLALPYLAISARPAWVKRLPKPGRWMLILKMVMGALLLATIVWLLWILQAVANPAVMVAVIAVLAVVLGFIIWGGRAKTILPTVAAIAIAGASFALPAILQSPETTQKSEMNWVAFSRSEIPKHVSMGHTVFVDVTADWCLTCKANKALVLDRAPVASALAKTEVIAMQADWTRPDPKILQFLEANGRFGIPFNIVYGPNAPEGIMLSEVLTEASVMTALSQAAGSQ
jgi:suppressor for copper-sensitivity B